MEIWKLRSRSSDNSELGHFTFLFCKDCCTMIFVIPFNLNTFSDWRRTCRGSKLTDLLKLSTRTWSGRASWNRVKFLIVLSQFYFSIFGLRGITKQLMTDPTGNREFCFPSTSMFLEARPRGTLRVTWGSWGNKTHCFPWGQSCA